MRAIITACLLVAGTAHVASASQWPVVVTTDSGAEVRGRLLSITPERVTLSRGGRLEPIPIERVVRVVKPRDSVLDGLLKGLLISTLPFILSGQMPDDEYAARFILGCGVIGVSVDALQGDTFVVYDRAVAPALAPRPAAALGWRVRF